jgi:hypothetical protein
VDLHAELTEYLSRRAALAEASTRAAAARAAAEDTEAARRGAAAHFRDQREKLVAALEADDPEAPPAPEPVVFAAAGPAGRDRPVIDFLRERIKEIDKETILKLLLAVLMK